MTIHMSRPTEIIIDGSGCKQSLNCTVFVIFVCSNVNVTKMCVLRVRFWKKITISRWASIITLLKMVGNSPETCTA
jgi:hypothetical protein